MKLVLLLSLCGIGLITVPLAAANCNNCQGIVCGASNRVDACYTRCCPSNDQCESSCSNNECRSSCQASRCASNCITNECRSNCQVSSCQNNCQTNECRSNCQVSSCQNNCQSNACRSNCQVNQCQSNCQSNECRSSCQQGCSSSSCSYPTTQRPAPLSERPIINLPNITLPNITLPKITINIHQGPVKVGPINIENKINITCNNTRMPCPLRPVSPTCNPPTFFNPLTRRCEYPHCPPPSFFDRITYRCIFHPTLPPPTTTPTPPSTPPPTTPPTPPYCPPPRYYNPVTGRCEEPKCPPPSTFDLVLQRCVYPPPTCPPPSYYDVFTQRCVYPRPPTTPLPPTPTCPPPSYYDVFTRRCVYPTPPTPPTPPPPPQCLPPTYYDYYLQRCVYPPQPPTLPPPPPVPCPVSSCVVNENRCVNNNCYQAGVAGCGAQCAVAAPVAPQCPWYGCPSTGVAYGAASVGDTLPAGQPPYYDVVAQVDPGYAQSQATYQAELQAYYHAIAQSQGQPAGGYGVHSHYGQPTYIQPGTGTSHYNYPSYSTHVQPIPPLTPQVKELVPEKNPVKPKPGNGAGADKSSEEVDNKLPVTTVKPNESSDENVDDEENYSD